METVEFSQEELQLSQFLLNNFVKAGGLTLGDIDIVYPLRKKLQEKIKIIPQTENPPVFMKPQDHLAKKPTKAELEKAQEAQIEDTPKTN